MDLAGLISRLKPLRAPLAQAWEVVDHNLFFHSNRIFAAGLWSAIIFVSYVAGNSVGGGDASYAATAPEGTLVAATITPPPPPAATPTPAAVPATPPLAPAPTPVPATPVPVAPPSKPAAVTAAAPVRYANNYSYGYCTYYVASRRNIPSDWGNAVNWYANAQADGYRVGTGPAVGAIAWMGVGYGHVAYVEQVSGGLIYISEMNFNGNWNRVTYRWAPSTSFRYIY